MGRSCKESRWLPPFGQPTDWQLHPDTSFVSAAVREVNRHLSRKVMPATFDAEIEVREVESGDTYTYHVTVLGGECISVHRVEPPSLEALERIESQLNESIGANSDA